MRTRTKFTLIELLIVISIIALLASLLLPALQKARIRAKSIQCVSNQKQCGIAFAMYANDFNGIIEFRNNSDSWLRRMASYAQKQNGKTYTGSYLHPANSVCPAWAPYKFDQNAIYNSSAPDSFIYASNLNTDTYNIRVPSPSASTTDVAFRLDQVPVVEKECGHRIPILAESVRNSSSFQFLQAAWFSNNSDNYPPNPLAHGGRLNMLFCDGHVEMVKTAELRNFGIKKIFDGTTASSL